MSTRPTSGQQRQPPRPPREPLEQGDAETPQVQQEEPRGDREREGNLAEEARHALCENNDVEGEGWQDRD